MSSSPHNPTLQPTSPLAPASASETPREQGPGATGAAHEPGGHPPGGHAPGGHVEQFDSPARRSEAVVLGMWVFLATEILFFGGLFGVYGVYRFEYHDAFREASRRL